MNLCDQIEALLDEGDILVDNIKAAINRKDAKKAREYLNRLEHVNILVKELFNKALAKYSPK